MVVGIYAIGYQTVTPASMNSLLPNPGIWLNRFPPFERAQVHLIDNEPLGRRDVWED